MFFILTDSIHKTSDCTCYRINYSPIQAILCCSAIDGQVEYEKCDLDDDNHSGNLREDGG